MRQEAIELIVALKGHTLPKGAKNAYNRLCKAIEQASSVSSIQSDKTSDAEKQEPVAVARVDDLERGGRVRALAMNLGLDAPLYTTPPHRKPLPKGEWPKHPSAYVNDEYIGYSTSDLDNYATQVLAAHGIKE